MPLTTNPEVAFEKASQTRRVRVLPKSTSAVEEYKQAQQAKRQHKCSSRSAARLYRFQTTSINVRSESLRESKRMNYKVILKF